MMTLKRFQALSHNPSLAAAAFSANQCSLGFNNVQQWSSIITNVQQYDKLAKLTNLLYLIMEVPVRDDLTHRFPQIFGSGVTPNPKVFVHSRLFDYDFWREKKHMDAEMQEIPIQKEDGGVNLDVQPNLI